MSLTAGISRPLTETVIRGHISALSETVIRECFATQSANLTVGWDFHPIFMHRGAQMKLLLTQCAPRAASSEEGRSPTRLAGGHQIVNKII